MDDRLERFRTAYRGLARSRQAFDTKRASDPAFSSEIETLYGRYIGTFRRYCGNCWHDAFMQLITLKEMENQSHFRVLAGTLLHDPVNRDVKYMLTPQRLAVMGDDLALRHLAHNPQAAEFFEKPLPANLGRMIADYKQREQAAGSLPAQAAEAPSKRRAGPTVRPGTARTKVRKAADGASLSPHEHAAGSIPAKTAEATPSVEE